MVQVLRQLLWLIFLRGLHRVACEEPKREVLVKEVVLDSAVVDIVYLGQDHQCVLVTTKLKRLYFSEDAGQSWTEITDKVDKSSSVQIQVERVIVNPTDKSVAVLQTQRRTRSEDSDADKAKWYPYIYVTEDSGRTWRRAWGKHHGLHSWISHPTKREWALVSWWNGNCGKNSKAASKDPDEEDQGEEKKPCVHRLMITRDLGKNFLQIAEYVVQFSWGSSAADQTNRVYFTAYRSRSGDQGRLSLWTQEVDFNYIELSGKGKPKGGVVESVRYGNKFLVSSEFILVAKVRDEGQQTVRLMVSKDGAKTFKAALLPSGMGELEEKWYTVLDTSEGAVILHINSNAEGIKDTGRIFISDGEGYRYSQSLVNNVRSAHGECEFDKVVSLQGVYMANIVAPDAGNNDQGFKQAKEKADEKTEEEAADGSAVDQKHGRGANKGKVVKAAKEERTIRTVVSFDKGGAWSYLKAPRVNSLGKGYECEGKPAEQCSLHLHGTTSWDFYAPFYSSESSLGIVMGTGNVGAKLRFEPEETSTFLSRDGGLTWMEAHKGAFIYEFGDHGGLIVMADDLKKTTEVVFSWNEGQNWYDFKVSKTPFEVDNIITEPNLTATTFIMFGTREEGVGVIYYMKFDSLGFPACNGVWAADSVSSDYETWTPSDGVNKEKCMLGQQVTYTRRKRTSQCWNGEKFERPVTQKKCECTQEDFACEIGFVRNVGSMDCVYGGPELMPERLVPTVCQKTYLTNAYRLVSGDKCEGGWSPSQAEVPCPTSSFLPGSSLKWGFIAALLLGLAYMGYTRLGPGSSGGLPSAGFGVFTAKTRMDFNPMLLLLGPLMCITAIVDRCKSGTRRLDAGIPYKRVQGDDGFDLDGMGNDESLTDFLDEADNDDHAPPVYDTAKAARTTIVTGSAHFATEEVPRLAGPPGGATLDITDHQDDLL